MNSAQSRYHGHRFPPEIISYAVWVYHRFCLSFRDVEDLLAERGIIVPMNPSGDGAGNSDPTLLGVSRKSKVVSGTLGIWTNFSSGLTVSSSIFGVPLTRTVMSSTFCCSLVAISKQPSGSSADWCEVKVKNRSGSSPTN